MDFMCPVDDDFLLHEKVGEKGGAVNIDLQTFERIQKRCDINTILPGGSAANTLATLARLGETCSFFSQIGKDYYGQEFINHLKFLGINPLISVLPNYPTSRVLCLITPDGQRTIRALDQKVPPIQIPTDLFATCKLAHFEARRLTSCDYVLELMQLLKKQHSKISLDLSSFETVLQHKEILLEIIKNYVDVLFSNQDEIIALTQLSAEQGLLEIEKICPMAVVTLGAEGCLIIDNAKLNKVPTFAAEVIDSTGAGDYFAGGFLYGYLHNYSILDCALLGNRLGAACVETFGAKITDSKWEIILAEL